MNFSACMREITNNSFHNSSYHGGKAPTVRKSENRLTNSITKTPGSVGRKSAKAAHLTPSRNSDFNCSGTRTPGGDRYIATRASETQMDIAKYLLSTSQNHNESSYIVSSQGSQHGTGDGLSPQKLEYQRVMSENLNGGVTSDSASAHKILRFNKERVPLAPSGFANAATAMYTAKPATISSHKKTMRHIPATADRVLDAPDIVDDYYLNLLDWGSNNKLAVALAGQLFLWDSVSGDINLLLNLETENDYVSSVCWAKNGNFLAVGISDSSIQLWDIQSEQRLRTLHGHAGRVGSLSWNDHVLSSGDKTGLIHNHDVRSQDPLLNVLNHHTQEVCGLKWSPNGRYLASGGNDNFLNIWSRSASGSHSDSTPLYTMSEHQAAVKALAWCPWQHNVLASGGGTVDRHIKLWNSNTGACLSSTDTQSQVCSLLWSHYYKELLSTHGYPNFELTIWKYPQMLPITELKAHTGRILHTSMSPCGEYVVSAAADETLRIWHCFQIDAEQKKNLKDKEMSSTKTTKSTAGKIMSCLR